LNFLAQIDRFAHAIALKTAFAQQAVTARNLQLHKEDVDSPLEPVNFFEERPNSQGCGIVTAGSLFDRLPQQFERTTNTAADEIHGDKNNQEADTETHMASVAAIL
jgi:hypothetical protein